jgi:predicted glycogen debranching enzyme
MDTTPDVSALSFDDLIGREWLATNALGGYASSTLPCLNTRKYHGLLVAAMAPPVRRMVLLSRVEETLHREGWPFPLASNEYPGTVHPEGYRLLRAFSHDPFPRWAYQGDGWALEKSLHLLQGQNTVCLAYTLLGGEQPLEMELRPLLALRGIHDLMYQWQGRLTVEDLPGNPVESGAVRAYAASRSHRVPPTGRTPEVFFAHDGSFEPDSTWYFNTIYRREQERGYSGLEDLWMPGTVRFRLSPGKPVYFACSADPIDLARVVAQVQERVAAVDALPASPSASRERLDGGRGEGLPQGVASDAAYAALARAAGQFVVSSRKASSEGGVGVIAQYPWAPPLGRDALIGFGGLFCATGRLAEARALLLSMAASLQDGLLPSEWPEDGSPPLYHSADASLWFVNAIHQYLRHGGDEATVRRQLYEPVVSIVERYRNGTRLGIALDGDGLLSTRETGVGTTWMDARAGDAPVAPRAGRPVELNALWYNALCIASDLSERFGHGERAAELLALSLVVKGAFNQRFWNPEWVCCFDVVGDTDAENDASIRPNQILASGLPFPVLDLDRHELVLEWVTTALLTPYGVRTLAPDDPNYQGRYGGAVAARERAQHNGPAYAWLLGPLVTTFIRVRGRGAAARAAATAMLRPCIDYLSGPGCGQLPELFDGNPPHLPGGAPASAAAVGEILRCYVEDVLDERPADAGPGLSLTLGDLSNVLPKQEPAAD